jgi:hypothetical protein
MKKIACLFGFLLVTALGQAQESARRPALPLTFSLFSESVSLPTLRGLLRKPNLGVRLGTELYYRNRPGAKLFQTVNLGYYYHRSLHHGLYVSTELGYRRYLGPLFVDGTIGGGYLHLVSRVPVYAPAGDGSFTKTSPRFHKFMPTMASAPAADSRSTPRCLPATKYPARCPLPRTSRCCRRKPCTWGPA